MTNNSANVIKFENVSFCYDSGKTILNSISLCIAENEFAAIVGRNGCGKTTLLKNLCGLLRPQNGKIFLRESDTGIMDIAAIAEEIGMVMQETDNQLFEATVFDEAAFPLRRKFSKNEISEKAEESLAVMGLVLAAGSRIIVLDEPAAGLDYRNCLMLMNIVKTLHGRGYTVIVGIT